MRRRLVLLVSFAVPLVACASLLGDFDVEPVADGGASSSSGTSGSSSGAEGGTDSGGEGGNTDSPQPTAVNVAASTNATCATVQYSKSKVTYCWGAEGAPAAEATVGNGDARVDGFSRPRLPTTGTKYLVFDTLIGSGTGGWFVGKGAGADGSNVATYAWGVNDNGECAAPEGPAMPNALKNGSIALLPDTGLYAAPNHGCAVQNQGLFCWGKNDNCELRSGALLTCNTEDPVLTPKNIARAVEGEVNHTSGKAPVHRFAGGQDHSCVEIAKGNGDADDIMCWGLNSFGQIDAAQGGFIDKPTTTNVSVVRRQAEIAAGENHTCVINSNTKITCWGKNDLGQANPANASAKTSPTEVKDVPGALSTLRAAGALSCVVAKPLLGPSRVYCWGSGPKARASDEATKPVGKVAGIQDVTDLAIGRGHACAVAKKEGATDTDPARLWCWGTNDFKRVDPRAAAGQEFAQPIEIKFPPEPTN